MFSSPNHKTKVVMHAVTAGFLNHFKEDRTVCTVCICSVAVVSVNVIPTLANICYTITENQNNNFERFKRAGTSHKRKTEKFKYIKTS